MAELHRLFLRAMAAKRPERSAWGFVDSLGGRTPGVRALALLMIGRNPEGPPPRVGTEQYVKYRSARRRVERYLEGERPTGKQRRGTTVKSGREAWLKDLSPRVWALATRRRVDRLQRRGIRTRLRGLVRISDDVRRRTMPDGGPGLLLTKKHTSEICVAYRAGKLDRSAELYEIAFLEDYFRGAPAAIVEADWCRVWADGDEEPNR